MTFQKFLEENNGKYVEVAGSPDALNQCTDLCNKYIRDVLELPIIEWTNAVDFPKKAGDSYDYIENTPTGIPQEGDMIVWKPSPGHIAIFIEGNVDKFTSFDQNFPIGSPCHVQAHTYQNVIGWLRKKVVDSACQIQLADEIAKKDENWKWGKEQETAKLNAEDQISRLKAQLLSQEKLYKELQSSLENIVKEQTKTQVTYDGRISELQNQINEKAKEIGRLNTLISEQAVLVKSLQDKALEGIKWYNILGYKVYIRKG